MGFQIHVGLKKTKQVSLVRRANGYPSFSKFQHKLIFFNRKVSVEIDWGEKGTYFAFQIHHWFEETAKIIAFVSSNDLNFPRQIFICMCLMR